MRLKHLQLQGYKSFAARAEFLFDSGITAVVGPNGSGKSNVADAIRWVLGEQSYSTLRGKKTEDMIFGGSAQRARMGMAQVAITLDNADRCLPIDYAEVTIERRAYRSGENEYLINGSRVRLKDIAELLSAAGLSHRTYAVIGQGLIDAALSLRPEERRLLFEEAAGITGHQGKRAEAVNRLHETSQNIIRVNDIINEIRPQLVRLQKQSDQAREHQRISGELGQLLLEWYGYQWHQAQQVLAAAMAKSRSQGMQVRQRQAELETLENRDSTSRSRQAELRGQIGEWHRLNSEQHARSERAQRELAVRQERLRLLEGQREDLLRELAPLRVGLDGQVERLQGAETELSRLGTDLGAQKARLAELEAQIADLQSNRRALVAERTTGADRIFQITTQISDRANRVMQVGERREAVGQERLDHTRQIQAQAARSSEIDRELAALRDEIRGIDAQTAELRTQESDRQARVALRREDQGKLQARLNDARREVAGLQTRFESLDRLRDDMANYYDGVRAAMKSGVSGLRGAIAGLVQVDAALDKAMETALGGHLQDVVADTWGSAQQAIEFLKKNRAGRATFLPLDNLHPPAPVRAPAGPGVVGRAIDLVRFDPELRSVFELLLGHTVVVEDLDVARRIFKGLHGGFQIVTRDGEVVRGSGAMTGGVARSGQGGGLLAREREWRELPAQIEAGDKRCRTIEAELAAAAAEIKALLGEIESLSREQTQLRAEHDRLEGQVAGRKQDASQLAREIEWRRGVVKQLEAEALALDGKEKELRGEQERLEAEVSALQVRAGEIDRELAALEGDSMLDEAGRLRTQVAVTESAIDNQRVVVENHRAGRLDLDRQIAAKEQRTSEMGSTIDALSVEIAGLGQQAGELSEEIARLNALIEPAEQELVAIERGLGELGQEAASLRSRLHALETYHAQANLEVQRRRDELDSLRRQMEEDIGLVETDSVVSVETQQPLPLKPLVSRLPTLTELPPGLDVELRRLKAQRQRLGTVNPNAPDEYGELLERYNFLSGQAGDLQQAAGSLQTVIQDLDQLIVREFLDAFKRIAARFRENFALFFGGGSARLLLTDPDEPLATGIDIDVKPPGKRLQSMNMLSGGERALTAAALLFAILKVSPTPFCVLDEVDAMLDEANVGRFRDAVRSLADETQFILITHNRRTVEVARTIYGISMGDDKASIVVSLKLDEADEAEPMIGGGATA